MKKLTMLALLVTMVGALPAEVMAQTNLISRIIVWPKPKEPKPTPEPATMLLVGAAGAGLAIARKLRSKRD